MTGVKKKTQKIWVFLSPGKSASKKDGGTDRGPKKKTIFFRPLEKVENKKMEYVAGSPHIQYFGFFLDSLKSGPKKIEGVTGGLGFLGKAYQKKLEGATGMPPKNDGKSRPKKNGRVDRKK